MTAPRSSTCIPHVRSCRYRRRSLSNRQRASRSMQFAPFWLGAPTNSWTWSPPTSPVASWTDGSGRPGNRRGRALAQPSRDGPAYVGGTRQRDTAVEYRAGPADIAAPDLDQRAQVGLHGPGDLVAGVEIAHVGLPVVHRQPPPRGLGRHSVEDERDRGARPRPPFDGNGAAHV